MKKWIPWLVLAVFLTEIIAILIPKQDKSFHLQEFGRLPILLSGRIQPFDSVGRNALLHGECPARGEEILRILETPSEAQGNRVAAGSDAQAGAGG
jgi:hypothetical protein